MFKWVGLSSFIVLFLLVVTILCVHLNTALSDNQLAQYRLDIAKKRKEVAEVELENALDTAKKRNETASVELENALYRYWVNQVLYKDVEFKDDWKKEVYDFWEQNGYEKGE